MHWRTYSLVLVCEVAVSVLNNVCNNLFLETAVFGLQASQSDRKIAAPQVFPSPHRSVQWSLARKHLNSLVLRGRTSSACLSCELRLFALSRVLRSVFQCASARKNVIAFHFSFWESVGSVSSWLIQNGTTFPPKGTKACLILSFLDTRLTWTDIRQVDSTQQFGTKIQTTFTTNQEIKYDLSQKVKWRARDISVHGFEAKRCMHLFVCQIWGAASDKCRSVTRLCERHFASVWHTSANQIFLPHHDYDADLVLCMRLKNEIFAEFVSKEDEIARPEERRL